MDYRAAYKLIMELQAEINRKVIEEAAKEARFSPDLWGPLSYRRVKALAATYELQEYLAGKCKPETEYRGYLESLSTEKLKSMVLDKFRDEDRYDPEMIYEIQDILVKRDEPDV